MWNTGRQARAYLGVGAGMKAISPLRVTELMALMVLMAFPVLVSIRKERLSLYLGRKSVNFLFSQFRP
jgi:hypothetical protein